jgi:mycothiol synthase
MPQPAVHRGPLDPVTAAEVRDTAEAAATVDRVPPLSEQPLLQLTSGLHVVHLLARDADARLTGYAQLDLGSPDVASGELVVDPQQRRRGIGRGLLDAMRTLAGTPADGTGRRTLAGAPADGSGPRPLAVWAHGDLPAARALAAAAGMGVVRELWRMTVDLDRHPPTRTPPLPHGVSVRAFRRGEDEERWRWLNARAFAHHPEQGRLTRDDLEARMAEPWFDPQGFLLAERDGVLLGSVWTKVHPAEDDAGPVGEIYVVGVDPDAQGLGLGGALTRLGLAHLADRGLRHVILYTDADNTVAVRTYTAVGFERTGVDVQFG